MLKVLFSGSTETVSFGVGVGGRLEPNLVVKQGNSNLDLFLRQCQPGC